MAIKKCMDRNYVLVSSKDIIRYMSSHKQDEFIYNECKNIFLNYDIEDNCFQLPTLHPIVLSLLKEQESPYYIDANILKEALAIAISENNYAMQKKLTHYFRKYMDKERNGIETNPLISEILEDPELIKFIKKHHDFDAYEQELVSKSYTKLEKQIRLSKENQIRGTAIL